MAEETKDTVEETVVEEKEEPKAKTKLILSGYGAREQSLRWRILRRKMVLQAV